MLLEQHDPQGDYEYNNLLHFVLFIGILHLFATTNKPHAVSVQEMRVISIFTFENVSVASFGISLL